MGFLLFAGLVAWFVFRETPTNLTSELPANPRFSDRSCGQLRDRVSGEQRSLGPGLVLIPLGKLYAVGRSTNEAALDSSIEPDERPIHMVNFEKPFALSACEITQDEYAAFAGATGRSWIKVESNTGAMPAVGVSWNDAVAYAKWLSNKTGARYRLPSEAEWQYAAEPSRVISYSGCYLGNTAQSQRLEACKGFGVSLVEVAKTREKSYGLYDMIGNAAEWTADCYAPNYGNVGDNGAAYDSRMCEERVFRGGSWLTESDPKLSRYRSRAPEEYRDYFLGFRVVRELSDEDVAEFERGTATPATAPAAGNATEPPVVEPPATPAAVCDSFESMKSLGWTSGHKTKFCLSRGFDGIHNPFGGYSAGGFCYKGDAKACIAAIEDR